MEERLPRPHVSGFWDGQSGPPDSVWVHPRPAIGSGRLEGYNCIAALSWLMIDGGPLSPVAAGRLFWGDYVAGPQAAGRRIAGVRGRDGWVQVAHKQGEGGLRTGFVR